MKRKALDKEKKNKIFIMFVVIIIIAIIIFVGLSSKIKSDREREMFLNDFGMGTNVILLDFDKTFSTQYTAIRDNQIYLKMPAETQGSLIYDFSKYDILPLLNYLYAKSENPKLINGFSKVMDFFSYNRSEHINVSNQEIFVKQPNGKYFYRDGDKYVYHIKKTVITKKGYNELYKRFLNSVSKTHESYFMDKLWDSDLMKGTYKNNYQNFRNDFMNHYDDMYKDLEEIIVPILGDSLKEFALFITSSYAIIEEGKLPIVNLDVEEEEIELFYTYKYLQNIYNDISGISKKYKLDLEDVWRQTHALSYPKLYM